MPVAYGGPPNDRALSIFVGFEGVLMRVFMGGRFFGCTEQEKIPRYPG